MPIKNHVLSVAARRKEISFALPVFSANNTVQTNVWAVGRKLKVTRVSFANTNTPSDTDGTMLIDVQNIDKSGADTDVIVNDFSAETLVANQAKDATLLETVEGGQMITILEPGDMVQVLEINNSAAINTNVEGLVMTIEYEYIDDLSAYIPQKLN